MANQKRIIETRPTSVPYIPLYIPGTKHSRDTLVKLYRVASDGTWEELRRSEFFKLAQTVSCPCAHICPELDGGAVYFVDSPTTEQQMEHIALCREMDRLRKNGQRAARCIYFETKKCDGWKPDSDGNRQCDTCPHYTACRQLSLDAPVSDDEGNEVAYGAHLPSTDATPEEAVIRKEERRELLRLLAALPEEDRRLVIASVQDGMDFGKLAELFGLSNRNYASKKTGRILERMRRDAQNFNR